MGRRITKPRINRTTEVNYGRGPQPVDPDEQATWFCTCGKWGNAKAQPKSTYDGGRSALTMAKKYLHRHIRRDCPMPAETAVETFVHAGKKCRTRHTELEYKLPSDQPGEVRWMGCLACGRVVQVDEHEQEVE